jgi:hypothetical protein
LHLALMLSKKDWLSGKKYTGSEDVIYNNSTWHQQVKNTAALLQKNDDWWDHVSVKVNLPVFTIKINQCFTQLPDWYLWRWVDTAIYCKSNISLSVYHILKKAKIIQQVSENFLECYQLINRLYWHKPGIYSHAELTDSSKEYEINLKSR